METFAVTGQDTLTLFDRNIVDLADGDATTVIFNEDSSTMSIGKNGNALFSKNEAGKSAEVTVRVVKGSADDKFLLQKQTERDTNFVTQELAGGQFVKLVGDGEGGFIRDVYTMRGGIFMRRIDARENVAGDTEQAVSVYRLKFASVKRSIQ